MTWRLVLALAVSPLVVLPLPASSAAAPAYVGAARCAQCHEQEAAAWRNSHHDLAMAEANAETVLGDFADAEFSAHGVSSRFYSKDGAYFVRTDGPDGVLRDYPIRYTFGWFPLQQYLIEFPRGHVQSLGIAWDSRPAEQGGQRWFHLYPAEDMDHSHPLHWTHRDQTWNYQCAECHSTNLEKNYQVDTDSYRTTWSEIDVACEACHGPGSAHLAWAEAAARDPAQAPDAAKGLTVALGDRDGGAWAVDAQTGKPKRSVPRSSQAQIQVCARCHSRRGQIWEDYEHGQPLGNTHRLALLDEQLYFPDGQIKDEVYVYGSFIQSRMYHAGVTCSDCHEPHSLGLRASGNALCGRCHLPSRYDSVDHHHHESGTEGAACTACHMPQRTYMVIDERADHSMRIPRPDLAQRLGTPDACTACHTGRTPAWAAAAVADWFPDSRNRGAHYGEALHAAAEGASDAGPRLAALAADPAQPGIARATALDWLRAYAAPQYLPTVQAQLTDDDPLIRAAAVRFLELTDLRTRVDLGWLLLDDPDRVVRLEAARVLAPLLRQQLPDQFRDQLQQAVEEYAQAQYVTADRPESQLNLGLIAVAVGDAPQAEQAYRTALRLDPGFAPAYANLADLYRQQGQDAQGEVLLRAGMAAARDNPDLPHALGLLLVREKRLTEALPYLRQAAESAADRPRYAYVYALALQGAGKPAEALAVLGRANQSHPGDRDILQALVSLHRELGQTEQAERFAQELATRYPQEAAQQLQ